MSSKNNVVNQDKSRQSSLESSSIFGNHKTVNNYAKTDVRSIAAIEIPKNAPALVAGTINLIVK